MQCTLPHNGGHGSSYTLCCMNIYIYVYTVHMLYIHIYCIYIGYLLSFSTAGYFRGVVVVLND